tara:strand:- start:79345 stop:79959 length:615 start_codon:yes stop_codon:yes gene_type:complete
MSRLTIPTVAASLLLLTGTAAAQYAQPAPPPPPPGYQQPNYGPPPAPIGIQRDGFVIGFSVGGGVLTNDQCDSCDSLEGGAFELHLGFMVTPQLALLVEGFGVSHTEQDITLSQSMGLLAAQYWVTPKLWIKGGLGSGRISVSNDAGEQLGVSEQGAGAMIAAGYEVYQGRAFAVDLSLRSAAVSYDESDTVTQTAATVGFNWY